MLHNPEFWYVALPTIFIGYFMFGVAGFGSSLITVPLLLHVASPAQLLPMLAVLDVAAATALGVKFRADADRSELWWLMPSTIIGAALGVTLLIKLPRESLMVAIGLFTLIYAGYQFYDPVRPKPLVRAWAPVAGLLCGVMGTVFGAGAPPYVMYLTRRIADKTILRSTITAMAALSILVRILAFAAAGLMFAPELWIVSALLAPVGGVALYVGNRVHTRITRVQVLRAMFVMLVVSGASLLVRAIAG
jgi:uncharacterized protein